MAWRVSMKYTGQASTPRESAGPQAASQASWKRCSHSSTEPEYVTSRLVIAGTRSSGRTSSGTTRTPVTDEAEPVLQSVSWAMPLG